MANGYGSSSSSSSSTSSTSSSRSSGSYTSGSSDSLLKVLNGVIAPSGFHYMSDGTLMSDAKHVAAYGYVEKIITGLDIGIKDINYNGESKNFSISGDGGAIFSLEIHDDDDIPNYYNFKTKTWSAVKSMLSNQELLGKYSFSVKFPRLSFTDATCDYDDDPTIAHDDDNGKIKAGMTVTGFGIPTGATVSSISSDTSFELSATTNRGAVTNGLLTFGGLIKKYTLNLHAEKAANIKTKHANYIEIRNVGNTIDLNKSQGSNSNLLQKTIYQDVPKTIKLSCVAPSLFAASADVVASFVDNRVVITNGNATDPNVVQVGDKVTGTGVAASIHALVTKINPDGDNAKEIEISVDDDIADGAAITFTPPFSTMTPQPEDTAGSHSVKMNSSSTASVPFSITVSATTGRTLTAFKTPNENDLCAIKTITFGAAASPIEGEDVSSSTFYRWPVDNVVGLRRGMFLDPARTDSGGTKGVNTTTPAIISSYRTTKTNLKVINKKYSNEVETTTVTDDFVNAVTSNLDAGNYVVDRNGNLTEQSGEIIFNVQQADALKSDTNVRIFGYGAENIKSLTGVEVALSNVVLTPSTTSTTTTTTSATTISTTIPVAEVAAVSSASTIRGVNINPSVANPTVLSKTTTSGAGSIIVSSAQTLENGQTLFFDGASDTITITGNVELKINNGFAFVGATDEVTLFFDVEKFLTSV